MTEEKQKITSEEQKSQEVQEEAGKVNLDNSDSLIEDSREDLDKKDIKKVKEEEYAKSGGDKERKDNIIFVGIKPFMNYVTGVVMQFQNKGQREVIVSARGKFTSKAIDVVEVARRTFLKEENIKIDDIKISSEQFENKEGKRIYVSAIEIKLVKE